MQDAADRTNQAVASVNGYLRWRPAGVVVLVAQSADGRNRVDPRHDGAGAKLHHQGKQRREQLVQPEPGTEHLGKSYPGSVPFENTDGARSMQPLA